MSPTKMRETSQEPGGKENEDIASSSRAARQPVAMESDNNGEQHPEDVWAQFLAEWENYQPVAENSDSNDGVENIPQSKDGAVDRELRSKTVLSSDSHTVEGDLSEASKNTHSKEQPVVYKYKYEKETAGPVTTPNLPTQSNERHIRVNGNDQYSSISTPNLKDPILPIKKENNVILDQDEVTYVKADADSLGAHFLPDGQHDIRKIKSEIPNISGDFIMMPNQQELDHYFRNIKEGEVLVIKSEIHNLDSSSTLNHANFVIGENSTVSYVKDETCVSMNIGTESATNDTGTPDESVVPDRKDMSCQTGSRLRDLLTRPIKRKAAKVSDFSEKVTSSDTRAANVDDSVPNNNQESRNELDKRSKDIPIFESQLDEAALARIEELDRILSQMHCVALAEKLGTETQLEIEALPQLDNALSVEIRDPPLSELCNAKCVPSEVDSTIPPEIELSALSKLETQKPGSLLDSAIPTEKQRSASQEDGTVPTEEHRPVSLPCDSPHSEIQASVLSPFGDVTQKSVDNLNAVVSGKSCESIETQTVGMKLEPCEQNIPVLLCDQCDFLCHSLPKLARHKEKHIAMKREPEPVECVANVSKGRVVGTLVQSQGCQASSKVLCLPKVTNVKKETDSESSRNSNRCNDASEKQCVDSVSDSDNVVTSNFQIGGICTLDMGVSTVTSGGESEDDDDAGVEDSALVDGQVNSVTDNLQGTPNMSVLASILSSTTPYLYNSQQAITNGGIAPYLHSSQPTIANLSSLQYLHSQQVISNRGSAPYLHTRQQTFAHRITAPYLHNGQSTGPYKGTVPQHIGQQSKASRMATPYLHNGMPYIQNGTSPSLAGFRSSRGSPAVPNVIEIDDDSSDNASNITSNEIQEHIPSDQRGEGNDQLDGAASGKCKDFLTNMNQEATVRDQGSPKTLLDLLSTRCETNTVRPILSTSDLEWLNTALGRTGTGQVAAKGRKQKSSLANTSGSRVRGSTQKFSSLQKTKQTGAHSRGTYPSTTPKRKNNVPVFNQRRFSKDYLQRSQQCVDSSRNTQSEQRRNGASPSDLAPLPGLGVGSKAVVIEIGDDSSDMGLKKTSVPGPNSSTTPSFVATSGQLPQSKKSNPILSSRLFAQGDRTSSSLPHQGAQLYSEVRENGYQHCRTIRDFLNFRDRQKVSTRPHAASGEEPGHLNSNASGQKKETLPVIKNLLAGINQPSSNVNGASERSLVTSNLISNEIHSNESNTNRLSQRDQQQLDGPVSFGGLVDSVTSSCLDADVSRPIEKSFDQNSAGTQLGSADLSNMAMTDFADGQKDFNNNTCTDVVSKEAYENVGKCVGEWDKTSSGLYHEDSDTDTVTVCEAVPVSECRTVTVLESRALTVSKSGTLSVSECDPDFNSRQERNKTDKKFSKGGQVADGSLNQINQNTCMPKTSLSDLLTARSEVDTTNPIPSDTSWMNSTLEETGTDPAAAPRSSGRGLRKIFRCEHCSKNFTCLSGLNQHKLECRAVEVESDPESNDGEARGRKRRWMESVHSESDDTIVDGDYKPAPNSSASTDEDDVDSCAESVWMDSESDTEDKVMVLNNVASESCKARTNRQSSRESDQIENPGSAKEDHSRSHSAKRSELPPVFRGRDRRHRTDPYLRLHTLKAVKQNKAKANLDIVDLVTSEEDTESDVEIEGYCRVVNPKDYWCEVCDEVLGDTWAIGDHLVTKHGHIPGLVQNPSQETCDICCRSYLSKINLLRHKIKVHGPYLLLVKKGLAKRKFVKRKKTPLKGVFSENHKKRMFLCERCDLVTAGSEEIIQHMNTHDNDTSLQVESEQTCDICEAQFISPLMILKHKIFNHSGYLLQKRKDIISEGGKTDDMDQQIAVHAKPDVAETQMSEEANPDVTEPQKATEANPDVTEPQKATVANPDVAEPQKATEANPDVTEPQKATEANLDVTEPQKATEASPDVAEPQKATEANPDVTEPQKATEVNPDVAEPQKATEANPDVTEPQKATEANPDVAEPQKATEANPDVTEPQKATEANPDVTEPQKATEANPDVAEPQKATEANPDVAESPISIKQANPDVTEPQKATEANPDVAESPISIKQANLDVTESHVSDEANPDETETQIPKQANRDVTESHVSDEANPHKTKPQKSAEANPDATKNPQMSDERKPHVAETQVSKGTNASAAESKDANMSLAESGSSAQDPSTEVTQSVEEFDKTTKQDFMTPAVPGLSDAELSDEAFADKHSISVKGRFDVKYVCKFCIKHNQTWTDKGLYRGHLKKHSPSWEIVCPCCCAKLKTKFILRKHLEMCIQEHNFICQFCGKAFLNKSKFLKHQQKHKRASVRCKFCCREFREEDHLRRHVDAVHFDGPVATFKHHHTCSHCSKSFKSKNNLKSHMKQHEGDAVRPFKCLVCESAFKYKHHLKNHVDSKHLGERRHQCEVCDKRFSLKHQLQSHMRIHSGDLFMCDYCGSKTTSKAHLNIHMRNHHPEKAEFYTCKICGEDFTKLWVLNDHIGKVHGKSASDVTESVDGGPREGTLLRCGICNAKFTGKYFLKNHMKSQHSGGGSEEADFKKAGSKRKRINKKEDGVKKSASGVKKTGCKKSRKLNDIKGAVDLKLENVVPEGSKKKKRKSADKSTFRTGKRNFKRKRKESMQDSSSDTSEVMEENDIFERDVKERKCKRKQKPIEWWSSDEWAEEDEKEVGQKPESDQEGKRKRITQVSCEVPVKVDVSESPQESKIEVGENSKTQDDNTCEGQTVSPFRLRIKWPMPGTSS
ncbi:uncharacterized protein LOC135496645 [Lineus longissimus]|uniref:uncharacterized protein LOC135496645 n=1 Tax=Lineus longissimus TaxID=88925 RepID=UPI00315CA9AE